MRVKAMRGEFSGGTVASLMNVVKEAAADPALRKELADPYSLCRPGSAPKVRQPDVRWAEFDSDFGSWVAPFVMSGINTRIVQRTNALSGQAYGADFTYDEAMLMGRGLKGRFAATALSAGLAGFLLTGAIQPARAALERFVLPKPGEGPSLKAQRKGFFDLRFLGTTATAARYAPRSRRPRPRLRLDRQNARPGHRVPRARHRQGRHGRRLLNTRHDLRRSPDRASDDRSGLTFELVPDLPPPVAV